MSSSYPIIPDGVAPGIVMHMRLVGSAMTNALLMYSLNVISIIRCLLSITLETITLLNPIIIIYDASFAIQWVTLFWRHS